MDSPVQNKKIQHWTTHIHGYNCKTEYTEGKKNICADMLSCLPHRPSESNDDNELSGPNITDKTFEVSMINSSNINLKTFAQYDHQITDNLHTKEELNLPCYDVVAEQTEQTKDKEILQLKEELQCGKASHTINSKYIVFDNVLYYLSKADSGPVIWLYSPKHLRKEVIEQYHNSNGHMGVDKTHDVIKTKFNTDGSCLSWIFWERENQSGLLVIRLIYIKLHRKKETKFWKKKSGLSGNPA